MEQISKKLYFVLEFDKVLPLNEWLFTNEVLRAWLMIIFFLWNITKFSKNVIPYQNYFENKKWHFFSISIDNAFHLVNGDFSFCGYKTNVLKIIDSI